VRGTQFSATRFLAMRNEEYDRELLVAVTMICTAVAVGASMLETTTPTMASAVAQATTRTEEIRPVRVIGTPFVPNTNPSARN
jgi:hypothetical protein